MRYVLGASCSYRNTRFTMDGDLMPVHLREILGAQQDLLGHIRSIYYHLSATSDCVILVIASLTRYHALSKCRLRALYVTH